MILYPNGKKTLKREVRQPAADFVLTYEFVKSKKDGRESYSLTVIKTSGDSCEIASADDISSSVTEARRIFDFIADGTVTPTTLYEILDDIL